MFSEETSIPYSQYESPLVTGRRYRESRYFLNDQLKQSESLQDFQALREQLQQVPSAMPLTQFFRLQW